MFRFTLSFNSIRWLDLQQYPQTNFPYYDWVSSLNFKEPQNYIFWESFWFGRTRYDWNVFKHVEYLVKRPWCNLASHHRVAYCACAITPPWCYSFNSEVLLSELVYCVTVVFTMIAWMQSAEFTNRRSHHSRFVALPFTYSVDLALTSFWHVLKLKLPFKKSWTRLRRTRHCIWWFPEREFF